MSDNVISIGSAHSGMSQLFDKSAKSQGAKKIESQKGDDQCLLLHVPLQNKSYFVPGFEIGITPAMMQGQMLPVFIFGVERAYSENKTLDSLVSAVGPLTIQRHYSLQITSTGIITEIVKVPSWWSKRDEGGF